MKFCGIYFAPCIWYIVLMITNETQPYSSRATPTEGVVKLQIRWWRLGSAVYFCYKSNEWCSPLAVVQFLTQITPSEEQSFVIGENDVERKLNWEARHVCETTPRGCHNPWGFNNVSLALQNNLAKIHNSVNHFYGENFKLKLRTCAQRLALAPIQSFSSKFS